jgi:hypothetical protein
VNSKAKGEITEAAVLTALLRSGHIVLQPFGDNQRYDLAIAQGNLIQRVQCKTGKVVPNKTALEFWTSSSYQHRDRPRKDYIGEVEFFGVYSSELEKCYLVPIQLCGKTAKHLRLTPLEKDDHHEVHWARDYEIIPR